MSPIGICMVPISSAYILLSATHACIIATFHDMAACNTLAIALVLSNLWQTWDDPG